MLSNICNFINNSIYYNVLYPNKIKFLSKRETSIFIHKDEDKYIASLSPFDLKARNSYSNINYLNKSVLSATDFKIDEKNKLITAIQKADNYLSKINSVYIDNFLIVDISWKFALTNGNTYENGLAHTRQDVIFLTPYIIEAEFNRLVETLIHEKIHLYQRYYKDKYDVSLYNNGYRIYSKRSDYSLIRANPDLDEYVYKDRNNNIMLGLYKTENPINILDITLYTNNINEHPNEEIAYSIARDYNNNNNYN